MSTVIGIFERQLKNNQSLTVTKPGKQRRKFTHIHDTVKGCFYAWKNNLNRHYSLSNNQSFKIITVARLFSNNIRFINKRLGERKDSSIPKKIGKIKIYRIPCNTSLKKYIFNYKKTLKK